MIGFEQTEDLVGVAETTDKRPVDRLKRLFHPKGFLLWILVIGLAILFWPATYGGRLGLVIVGGPSMSPTYDLGDAVVTWSQPVEVGDVVLYRVPEGQPGEGAAVIHRVVGGDGLAWVTKGDAVDYEDQWYPSDEDVLGVAQFEVPLGGTFLSLMRSWWFIAALGGLAVGLILWPDPEEEDEDPDEGVSEELENALSRATSA